MESCVIAVVGTEKVIPTNHRVFTSTIVQRAFEVRTSLVRDRAVIIAHLSTHPQTASEQRAERMIDTGEQVMGCRLSVRIVIVVGQFIAIIDGSRGHPGDRIAELLRENVFEVVLAGIDLVVIRNSGQRVPRDCRETTSPRVGDSQIVVSVGILTGATVDGSTDQEIRLRLVRKVERIRNRQARRDLGHVVQSDTRIVVRIFRARSGVEIPNVGIMSSDTEVIGLIASSIGRADPILPVTRLCLISRSRVHVGIPTH